VGRNLADKNPFLPVHANTRRTSKMSSSNRFDVGAILMKPLNTIVATISNQDIVIRINKDMVGILDLVRTHNTNKLSLKIKDLQPFAAILTWC